MGKSKALSSRLSQTPLAVAAPRRDGESLLTSQADTPQRRSNRATKGSNSDRWQEVLDSAKQNFVIPESVGGDTATDAGTVFADTAQQAQENQEDDDRIRCVCGQTEEIEDEDKDFVQCDQCHVWQHNQCVGLPAEIPETQDYFCERCRPDLHQKLLRDMANGKFSKKSKAAKKPDRKRKRVTAKATDGDPDHVPSESAILDEDDEDELTAKSPKRQRSVSLSEISVATVASEAAQALSRKPSVPVSQTDVPTLDKIDTKSTSKPASNAKSSGKSKKVAASAKPVQAAEDLKDVDRKKIAMALIRLVGDALNIAKEKEGFVLPGAQNPDETSRRIGLQIELALFDARLDAKSKFRQLSFNLKDPKNPSLRKRVFDGSLLPAELIQMSSEDMANPELKAKTEALREESLKQSVLIQETGPRIRRTHKGEEYVEGPDPTTQVSMEDTRSYVKHRVHDDDSSNSPLSIKSPSVSQSPISEPSRSPVIVRRERSGSNFDIKSVWSHIESPIGSESPARPRQMSQSVPVEADDNDEDILGLLGANGKVDPDRYDYGKRASVWQGQLRMPSVCDLKTKATLVGGPKTFDVDWPLAFSDCIQIDGRIPKPEATKYLCHQKFSQSKSVFAVQLEAVNGKENELKALYDYFTKKDRFGVIKPGKTRVRDGYIVPLSSTALLPEFVTMLPSFSLPSERTDMLLALLVIEKLSAKPSTGEIDLAANVVPPIKPAEEVKKSPLKQQTPAVLPSRPVQQQSTQWQPPAVQHPQSHPHAATSHAAPYQQAPFAEDPYLRRAQMSMPTNGSPAPPPPLPPSQLDSNAQAVLAAFLRAHPEIANNKQVTSSPQLMGTLLDEFVRGLQHR